jgi:hypothetical protein
MNIIISAAILGGIGGLTRGIVGLLKAMSKKEKLIFNYWLITIIAAVIVGVFVGVLFDYDYRLSLLAGYAGTDVLESIYKSFKIQKIYAPPS